MPAPHDFADLPDIREQTDNAPAQTVFLMTEAIAGHRSTPMRWNSFDVLVMVIRHINGHLNQPDCVAGTNDEEDSKKALVKQEKTNPILRLAWSRFEVNYQSQMAQDIARQAIKTMLWPSIPLPQFMELLESNVMLETLFGRESFLLFHPIVLSQRLESPKNGSWLPEGKDFPLIESAKQSLVRWDCEKGSLADCIESRFGMFENGERCYWYRCDKPIIMRVHFTVRPDMFKDQDAHNARHRYDVLQCLVIDGSEWVADQKTGTIKSVEKETTYLLSMVVRLADDRYDQRVLFRRYNLSGDMIEEPENFEHREKDWRLHDNSGDYVLFYARCSDNAIPRYPGPRFPEVPSEVHIEAHRRYCQSMFERWNAAASNM
ncbi:uncharacterized protein PG998_000012 [Apiospora kogelbergensis]|uniref:uncharacterized protein n=1 Tax=Apiospora kogelbergensis TaxID=1337665 RepID=UPI00312E327A